MPNPFQKEVKTWKMQRRELEQKRSTIEQKMTTKTCELSTIEEEISKVKCVDEGEVRQRAQNRADELQRLDEEVKQKEATENSTFQHGRNVQKTLDDLDQVSNYSFIISTTEKLQSNRPFISLTNRLIYQNPYRTEISV